MTGGRNVEATGGVKQSCGKIPGSSESRLISRLGLSQLLKSEVRRGGSSAFLRAGEERRASDLEGFWHFTAACYLATWCASLPCGGRRRDWMMEEEEFYHPGGKNKIEIHYTSQTNPLHTINVWKRSSEL